MTSCSSFARVKKFEVARPEHFEHFDRTRLAFGEALLQFYCSVWEGLLPTKNHFNRIGKDLDPCLHCGIGASGPEMQGEWTRKASYR